MDKEEKTNKLKKTRMLLESVVYSVVMGKLEEHRILEANHGYSFPHEATQKIYDELGEDLYRLARNKIRDTINMSSFYKNFDAIAEELVDLSENKTQEEIKRYSYYNYERERIIKELVDKVQFLLSCEKTYYFLDSIIDLAEEGDVSNNLDVDNIKHCIKEIAFLIKDTPDYLRKHFGERDVEKVKEYFQKGLNKSEIIQRLMEKQE